MIGDVCGDERDEVRRDPRGEIDAVVFDVGGVFLIPHPDPIAATLEPHGIQIDHALAERAHYVGVGALDACSARTGHTCYLVAYVGAIGIALRPRRPGPPRSCTASGPSRASGAGAGPCPVAGKRSASWSMQVTPWRSSAT